MAVEDLPRTIEITGSVLITETTNEARLETAQAAGVRRVQWSANLETRTCALCRYLDGKVFEAATAPWNPPAHINCDCIWIAVEDDEVGDVDAFDPADPALPDLVESHGHFLTEPEKYKPLRIPSAPGGRDFVVRRVKDAQGKIITQLEWRRPRYDLPGLTPETVQTGVAEIRPKWRPLGEDEPPDGDGGSFLPPLPTPPAPVGPVEPPIVSNVSVPPGGGPEDRVPLPTGQERSKTIREANARARELGVPMVEFGDHLELANHLLEGLRQAVEVDIPMPDEILIDGGFFAFHRIRSVPLLTRTTPANGEAVLIVNPGHRYWNDLQTELVKLYQDGYSSSMSPFHLVWHELGHVAHWRHDPARYVAQYRQGLSTVDKAVILNRVSSYGATEKLEAVAEVFAARLNSVEFDEQVMNIYRRLGGFPL